jgi:hypothetical protein
MKKPFLFLFIMIPALILAGCAEAIFIQTPGGSYEFLETRLEQSYDGNAAEQGRAYLLVYLEGKSASMEDMADSFFSNEKSSVSVEFGGERVPCQSIRYTALNENANPDIMITLVFDAPAATAETCVLAGDVISPITLNIKQ